MAAKPRCARRSPTRRRSSARSASVVVPRARAARARGARRPALRSRDRRPHRRRRRARRRARAAGVDARTRRRRPARERPARLAQPLADAIGAGAEGAPPARADGLAATRRSTWRRTRAPRSKARCSWRKSSRGTRPTRSAGPSARAGHAHPSRARRHHRDRDCRSSVAVLGEAVALLHLRTCRPRGRDDRALRLRQRDIED